MAIKKIGAKQNPKTGSYTVRVPKSALTGKFTSANPQPGTIRIQGRSGKAQ